MIAIAGCFYGALRRDRSMPEADYTDLITAAHQQLQAPVILIRTG